MALLVRVGPAGFAAGDVVQVEHALDIEGNGFPGLDYGQVSPVELNLAQIDDLAILNSRFFHRLICLNSS